MRCDFANNPQNVDCPFRGSYGFCLMDEKVLKRYECIEAYKKCCVARVKSIINQKIFGLEFKDVLCQNCDNFKKGEYSWGECTKKKEPRYEGARAGLECFENEYTKKACDWL